MAYMGSKGKKFCGYSKCKKPLPEGSRSGKKFCDGTCRVKSWKEKNELRIPDLLDRIVDLEKDLKKIKNVLKIQ